MSEERNLLQESLAAIERLQARLAVAERALHEPIAVVGMSCRIPGGVHDPQDYWQLLAEGRDAVGEAPKDRWDVENCCDPNASNPSETYTRAGGFVDEIELFEPSFFGISPREAVSMDPQQRLLLEGAWHALENACIPPDSLEGTRTGVFIGITALDYAHRIDLNDPACGEMYAATGSALNVAAGRISFTLGLRGPCMAIDTACSSSLVAIHTACQSLRTGESDLAISGGVNVILRPEITVLLSKFNMLSPDGRCKTFDASANGFVRSEGCALVVLKRLRDAQTDGDNILAVIRGSAINQDGRSSGLTVPNGNAQQEVIRQSLRSAGLAPTAVSYVEAHGTATSLGDPIEVEALAAAYGEGRSPDDPLEIGSVKSNLGHLESASGATSLIKVVLALQQRQLPASLHFQNPTPSIPWHEMPLRVSTQLHDWRPSNGRRLAGVSAFGFSGMNAHVILEEAPALQAVFPDKAPVTEHLAHLLVLSAKTESALVALAARYADHLALHPDVSLADMCFTAATGRAALPHRLAVIASSHTEMMSQLRAAAVDGKTAVRGRAVQATRMRVAFLFTGQGSQYVGMGRDLYDSEPTFRTVIDRCAAVLDPLLERPLREVMFNDTQGLLDQTGYTQPALYALEIAIASMWRSWGVEPTMMIGHSVGEYAAAALADMFTIEDGARLIAARGRLMQALPTDGMMISVQGPTPADMQLVKSEVAVASDRVSIAAWNGPASVVIAGARAETEAIAARLTAQGLRTQPVVVSHAFHSPLMAPMLDEFERIANKVNYQAPRIAWVSTLDGERFDWSRWQGCMARYWTEQVRSAVCFEHGMRTLGGEGCDVYLEVGPHPVLVGMGRGCAEPPKPVQWLASLNSKRGAWEQVLDSTARLFVSGASFDWVAFNAGRDRRRLVLPSYPFQRQRFWIDPPKARRQMVGHPIHELLGVRVSSPGVAACFESNVAQNAPTWLADHRVGSEVVMPFTGYLEAAMAAVNQIHSGQPMALQDADLREPMVLSDGHERIMQVVVDLPSADNTSAVRIYSRDAADEEAEWLLHVSLCAGQQKTPVTPGVGVPPPIAEVCKAADDATQAGPAIDTTAFYDGLRELGIEFGPAFTGLQRVWRLGPGKAMADIAPAASLGAPDRYVLHPALLDACLHAGPEAIRSLPDMDPSRVYLPVGVERYRVFGKAPVGTLRSLAIVREQDDQGDSILIDFRIETETGAEVAVVEGLRCRSVSRDVFRRRQLAQAAHWLHEVAWKEQPLHDSQSEVVGKWLVFDEGAGRGERLAGELVRRGGTAIRVLPGVDFARRASDIFEIDPTEPQHYVQLLAECCDSTPLVGVLSLWPMRVPATAPSEAPSRIQRFGTESSLHLVHALMKSDNTKAPRLWFVTAGSQWVDGTETPRIEQAPAAALVRVIATELPDLRATLIDIDPQGHSPEIRTLVDELVADSDEIQIALRKGSRHVMRLVRHQEQSSKHAPDIPTRLGVERRGTFENLVLAPMQRRAPGHGEVELRVRASGINFRDVLITLDLYPGPAPLLGSDCSGEIVAVGEGVSDVKIGDRVVAMVEGAFASFATTRREFVAPLPANMDFEQGAAVPSAFLTADITLNQIACMKRGDKVLIHAGAGGVGMAAIMLARRAGAEIFATAGSPEKREVLKEIGVQHVFDSRSTSFADEIRRITDGRGVDIVLNSLAGDIMARSFDSLVTGGTFLEIGKLGVWTPAQVAELERDLRFQSVDCSEIARQTPAIVSTTLERILDDIGADRLEPLPITTFAFERAADAFQYMAHAKHIGRVVLRHSVAAPVPKIVDDGSYVITGGLKGLGLVAAQWLVREGARHLLLAGRGAPDAKAKAAIESMTVQGAHVRVVSADVSTDEGVARLMEPLGGEIPAPAGLIHCAGVLDDAILEHQTPEHFVRVMSSKADSAWRLHQAFGTHGFVPDMFVLYSSLASVFGSPGQGNYVAANAFLDALAQARGAKGLPGQSINWGPWKGTGMATRGKSTIARAATLGMVALAPEEGMAAFALAIQQPQAQIAVMPIQWPVFAQQFGPANGPPLLRDMLNDAHSKMASFGDADDGAKRAYDLASLDGAERRTYLAMIVRHEIGRVLMLSDSAISSIGDDQNFMSLGLDSLTAVELRNRLQQAVGCSIPSTAAFEWPTVADMAQNLDALFGSTSTTSNNKGGEEQENREEFTL